MTPAATSPITCREPYSVAGATLRVFLGGLAGDRSPVHTFTPLLGAQIDLDPGARLSLDVDSGFEHGVLLDQGSVEVAGTALEGGRSGIPGGR